MTSVDVVVTCHDRYLGWLPSALESIDAQTPSAAGRVVVLDACPTPALPPGWRSVTGRFGNPSLARNAGYQASGAEWAVFWDADNVMPPGYLDAVTTRAATVGDEVAILYPDLQHCDADLTPTVRHHTPDWSYWGLRAENFVDTASAWRREALDLAGGWPATNQLFCEDFALALRLTAAGWRASKLGGPAVLKRALPEGRQAARHAEGAVDEDLWRARSLAVVTLLAGRHDVFDRWLHFLRHADLPDRTALYLLDNSEDRAFSDRVRDAADELARSGRFTHVDLAWQAGAHAPAGADTYFTEQRHRHVARLYGSILPRVHEDLVLTLEDDVEPPLDAALRLGSAIGGLAGERIGAVGGAYSMPHASDYVCVGLGDDGWGDAISWPDLPRAILEVGHLPGGCTMWANWALKDLPVNFWWRRGLGWDGSLSLALRRKGYRLLLHGGVRCEHHLHSQVSAPGGAGAAGGAGGAGRAGGAGGAWASEAGPGTRSGGRPYAPSHGSEVYGPGPRSPYGPYPYGPYPYGASVPRTLAG